MNILIVANAVTGDQPGLSGGEVRLFKIAGQWSVSGHSVDIIGGRGLKVLAKAFNFPGVIHEFASVSDLSRFGFFRKLWLSLLEPLPRSLGSYDLVYAANEMIIDVLPLMRLRRHLSPGGKLAVVCHWVPPPPRPGARDATLVNQVFFWLNERLGLRLAFAAKARILAVSQDTRNSVIRAGGRASNVVSVACGVEISAAHANTLINRSGYQYDAIFIKRLQRSKGVFHLVEIWSRVVRERPHSKLAIVGEGVDGEAVKQRVRELGLDRNIDFLGLITDESRKNHLLSTSQLFLLPTLEENWAIVIGEALALRVPVVASQLPELQAVWGDTVHWCAPGNIEQFARMVLGILGGQVSTDKKSRDGYDLVRRLSWDAVAEAELAAATST